MTWADDEALRGRGTGLVRLAAAAGIGVAAGIRIGWWRGPGTRISGWPGGIARIGIDHHLAARLTGGLGADFPCSSDQAGADKQAAAGDLGEE